MLSIEREISQKVRDRFYIGAGGYLFSILQRKLSWLVFLWLTQLTWIT
jgi:hypothetical protein